MISAFSPRILQFYVAKSFLFLTACATASLCLLIDLFDLIDLLRKMSGQHHASAFIGLKIAALHLPFFFLSILPFGILLGAICCFFFLSRASEVTAARAAAISAWQFMTAPLLCAFLLGLFSSLAVSPLSAACYHRASLLEEKYFNPPSDTQEEELWLKEKDSGLKKNGHMILHLCGLVPEAQTGKKNFLEAKSASILRLDSKNNFLRRIESQQTRLQEGKWVFENAVEISPGQLAKPLGTLMLPSHLTATRAKKIGVSADTLSIWNLPRTIAWLRQTGFPVRKQLLHLYALFSLPFLSATMLLIAAGFALRPFPQGQHKALRVIGIGVGTGFCLFALSKIAEQLGISGSIPPFFAALLPLMAGLCLAGSLLLKMEEG